MRRRFFVERFENGRAVLREEAAHHLGRVLRAEAGQLYELSDSHSVWLGRIERIARAQIEFSLLEPIAAREPAVRVVLLLSIVKFDRFEWCLEKGTELGMAEVVPLAAARSEKGLLAAAPKRTARWGKILLESAQQARCLRPPVLRALVRPEAAFADVGARQAVAVLLSERLAAPTIKAVLGNREAKSVVLAVGPEGGWTEEEFAAARASGFLEASLGPHILRTETAVTAALAVLNYALGD
jgi:16S rRNA (uracil1498-N3)-methyltransferase